MGTPETPQIDAPTLTSAAQNSANALLSQIDAFANSVFDAGEAGLKDALKVVNEAQTRVSALLTEVTSKL